jgi:hypothetical protein
LLYVEEPIKDPPEDTALAEHVDLTAIRSLVSTALPGRTTQDRSTTARPE